MAVDEWRRHELHAKLREILGADQAATLMEMVPTKTWDDLVTKEDLQTALVSLKHELTATFRKEIGSATSSFVRATIIGNAVSVATIAGIAFAAARVT